MEDAEEREAEAQLRGALRNLELNRLLKAQAKALRDELEEVRQRKAPGAAGALGSGGIGRLQQLLVSAGLDATIAEYAGLKQTTNVQGVPCPEFSRSLTVTLPPTHTDI